MGKVQQPVMEEASRARCLRILQQPPSWTGRTSFWKVMATLMLLNCTQGVLLTMPFTLSVYMCRLFLKAQSGTNDDTEVDEQRVAQLTGALAASFSLAQFTTSMAWGWISNIIGRKRVITIGCVVSVLSIIWFGSSGTYGSAVASRIVGGLLNGILGAWKCLIGECGDTLVQGTMFAYMSVAWGIGTVVGPLIGGGLARPCDHFPGMAFCGDAGLFKLRPFLLPCLVGALTMALSAASVVLLLEETLDPGLQEASTQAAKKLLGRLLGPCCRCLGCSPSAEEEHAAEGDCEMEEGEDRRVLLADKGPTSRHKQPCQQCPALPDQAIIATTPPASHLEEGVSDLSCSTQDSSAPHLVLTIELSGLGKVAKEDCGKMEVHRDMEVHNGDEKLGLLDRVPTTREHSPGSSSAAQLTAGSTGIAEAGMQLSSAGSSMQDVSSQDTTSASVHPFLPASPVLHIDKHCCKSGPHTSAHQSHLGSRSEDCDEHAPLITLPSPSHATRTRTPWLVCSKGPYQPVYVTPGHSPSAHAQNKRLSLAAPGHSAPTLDATDVSEELSCPATPSSPPAWGGSRSFLRALSRARSVNARMAGFMRMGSQRNYGRLGINPYAGGSVGAHPHSKQSAGPGTVTPPATPRHQAAQGSGDTGAVLPWHKDMQVLLTIAGYGAVAMLYCCLDELLPIFAAAPSDQGGLGLIESELAIPLSVYGVALILYSGIGYPALQTAMGTLPLTRLGLVVGVIVCFMLPLTHTMLRHGQIASQVLLFITMVVKSFAQSSSFTGALVMVNAAPHRSQLGQVNGVGQTLASLVRGIGPAAGGLLWAASLSINKPGQQFLPFGITSLVAVAALAAFHFVRAKHVR